MIRRLNHIAVAVPDLDAALQVYEQILGVRVTVREQVPDQKVQIAFLPVGETRIELVQPDSPNSPISRFLEQRGPGLHHICFEVDDLSAELERLKAQGIRLIDQVPRPGAHGSLVAFVHPAATRGVLIELMQANPAGGNDE